MLSFYTVPYSWTSTPPASRVEAVCASWSGTAFANGQAKRGVAVDCIHYVCAVLDELSGVSLPMPPLKYRSQRQANRSIRDMLQRHPAERIDGLELWPGDVLVLGDNDGVRHVMIAGGVQNHLWHVGPTGVNVDGCGFRTHVLRVYRPMVQDEWIGRSLDV